MNKIGIYTDPSKTFLIIETRAELAFELLDHNEKLLITGNKLQQPSISINIKRLPKGSYTLRISIDGERVYKTIEL